MKPGIVEVRDFQITSAAKQQQADLLWRQRAEQSRRQQLKLRRKRCGAACASVRGPRASPGAQRTKEIGCDASTCARLRLCGQLQGSRPGKSGQARVGFRVEAHRRAQRSRIQLSQLLARPSADRGIVPDCMRILPRFQPCRNHVWAVALVD